MANTLHLKERFPRLSGIYERLSEGERAHTIGLVVVAAIFLGFGLNHLGQFITVDEEKWLYVRVRQLYIALTHMNWARTYVNDKPGLLPSLLAGIIENFTNINRFPPHEVEKFLFFWRLPVLLFNFGMLLFIYRLLKELLNATYALFAIAFIGTNPLIIGISQIVNPDTTLWSTCTASALAFFLYIQSNRWRYVVLSAFFLSLALISKFSATYFFLAYYVLLYIGYLVEMVDREALIRRSLGWLAVVGLASIGYFILFPATWIDPALWWKGTLGCPIIAPVMKPFSAFVIVSLAEASLFEGRAISWLLSRIDTTKILHASVGAACLALALYLVGRNIINPGFWGSLAKGRGRMPFVDGLFGNILVWLFTENTVTLLAILVFAGTGILFLFRGGARPNHEIRILLLMFILGLGYIVGSGAAGYFASSRYQALSYPLYAITAGGVTILLFRRRLVLFFLLVVCTSTVELTMVSPFYYCFSNRLNVHNHVITGAWGFGGYEMAQWANALPNAMETKIWYDREGFGQFFVGEGFRWNKKPWEIKNLDYLLLTHRGKLYAKAARAGKPSRHTYGPLLEYYSRPGVVEMGIGGNPANVIKLVPYDASEIPQVLVMQRQMADAIGHFDMSEPQSLAFWIKFDAESPGRPFTIQGSVKQTFQVDAAKKKEEGDLIFQYDAPADEYKSFVTTKKINDGQWHFVVLYQTGGTMEDNYGVYVDGVLTDSSIVPRVKEDMVWVRKKTTFKGEIKKGAIYPRVLTSEEIRTLHAAGPEGETPGIDITPKELEMQGPEEEIPPDDDEH